jgi:rod shape-determining protein MreC
MGQSNTQKMLLAVLAIGLTLIMLSLGQYRTRSFGNNPLREGFFFFQKVITTPFSIVHGLWTDYVALVHVRQENKELKKKIELWRVECMTMQQLRSENERLRSMLEYKTEAADFKLFPARILNQDISMVFKTVIIDKGNKNLFSADMPVVSPLGLVGRVITASPHTSQVLLITDPNSAIPVVIADTGVKGIVKGTGSNLLSMEYVRNSELITVGSLVVTSGLEGIFPKGLKVGRVQDVYRDKHKIFMKIMVAPSVEMSKLDGVFGIGRHGKNPD